MPETTLNYTLSVKLKVSGEMSLSEIQARVLKESFEKLYGTFKLSMGHAWLEVLSLTEI